MTASIDHPVRFDPAMERPEPDEAETTQALIEQMRKVSQTVHEDTGTAVRSVHAKSHGLLRGELRVLDRLPEPLAQGLFARPETYPVVMRFSTNPGDILDDSVSVPRGLAVKIVGVTGERLPGSEDAATQNLVMVNGPAFTAPDAKTFLKSLKLLAATTDTPQVLKKALSATLRGVERVVEAVGGESPTLKGLGGHPQTEILGETFYTQVPLLHGAYIAKLSIAPVSPELTALTGKSLETSGRPNALRDGVVEHFRRHGGEWELRVQLCTDLDAMPIEDAAIVWPEDRSSYVAIARITAPPQEAWSDARSAAIDGGMAFSPWHGLAAHRPLGSVMRARKQAYEMSARFRAERNRQPVDEPRSLDHLP